MTREVDADERQRRVDFHQAEVEDATRLLVEATKAAAEAEAVRLGLVDELRRRRQGFDAALHALVAKAGKP